jgi:hypothetical protein
MKPMAVLARSEGTVSRRALPASVLPGIATNNDDPAAVFHVTDGCLHTDKRGTQVDGDHAVEVIETLGVDCAPGEDAGIADKDIEWAEGFCCFGHRAPKFFGRGAVGSESERFTSRGFDFAYKFEGLFF